MKIRVTLDVRHQLVPGDIVSRGKAIYMVMDKNSIVTKDWVNSNLSDTALTLVCLTYDTGRITWFGEPSELRYEGRLEITL